MSIAANGVLTGIGGIAGDLVFGGQIISANLTFDGLFNFGSIIDSEITVLGEMINASTLLFEGETELIVHGQLTNGFNGFGFIQLENGIVRAREPRQ